MGQRDILIVVKTYPEISTKYTETVCTAGILADTKTLVRLYPIRFRYFEGKQQFKKYQWIKADINKATANLLCFRFFLATETARIADAAIQLDRDNVLNG